MKLGKVLKQIVSSEKIEKLDNHKVFLVETLEPDFKSKKLVATGEKNVMIDLVGAGVGEIVFYIKEGGSMQSILQDKKAPFIFGIIGTVDSIEIWQGGEKVIWKLK